MDKEKKLNMNGDFRFSKSCLENSAKVRKSVDNRFVIASNIVIPDRPADADDPDMDM